MKRLGRRFPSAGRGIWRRGKSPPSMLAALALAGAGAAAGAGAVAQASAGSAVMSPGGVGAAHSLANAAVVTIGRTPAGDPIPPGFVACPSSTGQSPARSDRARVGPTRCSRS
jgi:hypothetical protein